MADPTNPDLDPEQSQAAQVDARLKSILSQPNEEYLANEAVLERSPSYLLRKAGTPARSAERHAERAKSTVASGDIASSKWHALQAEKAAAEVEVYAAKLRGMAQEEAEKMQGLIDQADVAVKAAREHAGMSAEQRKGGLRSWFGSRRR